jgi:hypothetical protein
MAAKLICSFREKNIRLANGHWLFKRAWPMRFEWLALMAYKRVTFPSDQTWVRLQEIAQLPSWGGKSRHDTSTNVGRYLQSTELKRFPLITARTKWSGPYQLNADAFSIAFDLPLRDVRRRLQIRSQPASTARRAALIQFTHSFARAQWLVFQGRLERKGPRNTTSGSAYEVLMRMAEKEIYTPALRLLALLSAIDVLFRMGRFQAARRTLMDNRGLLRRVDDSSLKARFYLRLAWAYQRSASGIRSDRAVEGALQSANFYAQSSGDRATLGLLARRTAGYLTKKGQHMEAVNHLMLALEADLITGNYDSVQITCGDIGSDIHRLGLKFYDEARLWLLLSIAVARMMRLGRDDGHAELILAKIHLERGRRSISRWLLERAERIAERAGNRVNLADVKMVWGFWCGRFGSRKQQIDTLGSALLIFRQLSEFDARQKERYMERSFPMVWQEVVALVKSASQRAVRAVSV